MKQTRFSESVIISILKQASQEKMCMGRTPMKTFLDVKQIWKEKGDNLNLN